MQPEDMYADDAEIERQAAELSEEEIASAQVELRQLIRQEAEYAARTMPHDISDYNELYNSLYAVVKQVEKSLVTVTVLTSDTSFINELLERSGATSGLIIADNGGSLLILTQGEVLKDAGSIMVTFDNGSVASAFLRMSDRESGLAVIAVQKGSLDTDTLSAIRIADLGSSSAGAGTGSPVVAAGSPTGMGGSIGYGMITADKSVIDMPDAAYRLLYTDIPGSASGTGVLADTHGQIMGIIAMQYADSDRICAMGITELKPLIENLSNRKEHIYTGIHGTDIPDAFRAQLGIPEGAYVSMVELDSPAMLAGIQSGDIITGLNGEAITDFEKLAVRFMRLAPEEKMTLRVLRQVPDGYAEMDFELVPIGTGEEER